MKYILFALIFFFLTTPVYAEVYPNVKVSWYAKGLKDPSKFTTACWSEFKKGTKFKVTKRKDQVE